MHDSTVQTANTDIFHKDKSALAIQVQNPEMFAVKVAHVLHQQMFNIVGRLYY
jgi:hypothetical protein